MIPSHLWRPAIRYLGEVDRALDGPRATRGRHQADAPALAAAILNLKQLHVLVFGQHVFECDKLGADDQRRQRLGAQLCGRKEREEIQKSESNLRKQMKTKIEFNIQKCTDLVATWLTCE